MNRNIASKFAYWLLAPAAAVPIQAIAVEYLTIEQAQRQFFPATSVFIRDTAEIPEAQQEAIEELSDTSFGDVLPRVSRVEINGALAGFFIVDDVIGKHDYITYAVALSPSGAVQALEILEYRETYGEGVKDAEWRRQFIGKTSEDTLKLGSTIQNFSGATYSSRHLTEGIRRLLALYKVMYAKAS